MSFSYQSTEGTEKSGTALCSLCTLWLINFTSIPFSSLDYRFETINIKLDSLEKRIPVIEKITALKIRMADLEKRLAVA